MTTKGANRIVRLLVDHPHNGKKWPANTRLAVSARLADWWIAQGIARDDPIAPKPPKPRTTVQRGGCCGRAWSR